jgi:predicted NUDIX family NTP pyrophosphohydrolase
MPKRSAGVLLFRKGGDGVEVLLVHPGGPFWAHRDAGAWSIPKGEYEESEDAKTAARREFWEETGAVVSGPLYDFGVHKQQSGKLVSAFGAEGDFDPEKLTSNRCRVEWPPRSGRVVDIPEVDRAAWFSLEEARRKITWGQIAILRNLEEQLAKGAAAKPPDGAGSRAPSSKP